MTCKNTLPWKSKPTKLYPLLKRESFHPYLAIRCFDWTFRATKKNIIFFTNLKKYVGSKLHHDFFQITSGGKFQKIPPNLQKNKLSRRFTHQGGFCLFLNTCRQIRPSTRLDPRLSGESLSSTPMEDFTPKGLSWTTVAVKRFPRSLVKRFGMSGKFRNRTPNKRWTLNQNKAIKSYVFLHIGLYLNDWLYKVIIAVIVASHKGFQRLKLWSINVEKLELTFNSLRPIIQITMNSAISDYAKITSLYNVCHTLIFQVGKIMCAVSPNKNLPKGGNSHI